MPSDSQSRQKLASQHLKLGWALLSVFVILGICLEAFHGFKVDWYLNVAVETRRLTWRLAHAHGTFLAVVHLLFSNTLDRLSNLPRRIQWISRGLTLSSIFIPLGFAILAAEFAWARHALRRTRSLFRRAGHQAK